ncbi:MAG: DNA-binding response regulator [Epsilonproteobacteria bacterium]|jgi:two-component system OmpR family response regulator|nr:DNA-binding response regulator [Campylobacterota bacterium]NPA89081.1 response regulator transcription factor [Campylobacterota bacterium]
MRFLIIEPDKKLMEEIKSALLSLGISKFEESYSLKDGKYCLEVRGEYDLAIIDSDHFYPAIYTLLSSTRLHDPFTKILILSSNQSVEEEIKMLKMGADDYLRKPINWELFKAKINVHLRRWEGDTLRIKDLVIKPKEEKVYFKGEEVGLKGKAFELFLYLARHPNQVITKERLLHSLWEDPDLVSQNVIEVNINTIRKKVDKRFKIATIETIRRRGYKFCYPKE